MLFDQNYQFDEIGRLREMGVRTIGRFVWEQFEAGKVEDARKAFDAVYSMHAGEQERYADLGIETPRVRWGVHPELLEAAERFAVSAPGDGAVASSSPAAT